MQIAINASAGSTAAPPASSRQALPALAVWEPVTATPSRIRSECHNVLRSKPYQRRHLQRMQVAAEAAAQPSAAQEQQTQAPSPLQAFLRWLLANGVEGVGTADSKVGLYEGEGGERGVVSLQPIAAGEVVMRLGTRLAVADHQEAAENEGNGLGLVDGEEQPWSVRLASKLLHMVQQGTDCPWQEYLNVLPRSVPSPLTTFSWEDVQAIEYEPMRRQVDHASWLAASACQRGGDTFTREQWDWALSVVHSRTFGTPGQSSSGGVGVRMLVPLVDMLNHAGDYLVSPPGAAEPRVQAFDNVRWDLKAPSSPEGDWEMVVTATRDIPAGEELLLSYGERSNDDFMLHYGFCPPRNPHDEVQLFQDIEAAIDWWLDTFLPAGALPPQHLQLVINSAYAAAEQEDGAAVAAEAVLANVPEAEAEVIRAQLETIKLSAGGLVDGRLLAAYRALFEAAASSGSAPDLGAGWQQHMQTAVGKRCWELLQGMPTPLLQDLERLATWEQETGQQQHCWAAAQRHYSAALAAYEAEHGSLPGHNGDSSGSSQEDGAQTEHTRLAAAAGPALLDAGADAELAQLLLQQAPAATSSREASSMASQAAANSSSGGTSILPVQYRCYKKMALWDAVLLSAA